MTYQRTIPDSTVSAPRIGKQTGFEFRLSSPQPLLQLQHDLGFNSLAQQAFPDDCDSPASLKQMVPVAPVSFHVGMELGLPELCAHGRGCHIRAAGMPMPKTAMNKAYRSELTKHEIRSAGEFPVVQTVSQATGMKSPAESKFRLRVPAADSSHHARTGSLVYYVRHRRPCLVFKGYNQERLSRKVPSWCQYPCAKNGSPVSKMGHKAVGNYSFIRFPDPNRSSFPAISVSSRRRGGKP